MTAPRPDGHSEGAGRRTAPGRRRPVRSDWQQRACGAPSSSEGLHAYHLLGGAVADTTFDVVVVGAGPAGSTAALVLARGGARVALVDKATFGRDKACGDLVGPRALALLTSLGLTPPAGPHVGSDDRGRPHRAQGAPARPGRTHLPRPRRRRHPRCASMPGCATRPSPPAPNLSRAGWPPSRDGTVELDRRASTRRRRRGRCRRRHQRRCDGRRPRRPRCRAVGLRSAGLCRPGRRAPDHRPVGRDAGAWVPRLRLAVPGGGGHRQHRLGLGPAAPTDPLHRARSTASTPFALISAGSASSPDQWRAGASADG